MNTKQLQDWDTPFNKSPKLVQYLLENLKEEFVGRDGDVCYLKPHRLFTFEKTTLEDGVPFIGDIEAGEVDNFAGYVYSFAGRSVISLNGLYWDFLTWDSVSFSECDDPIILIGIACYFDLERLFERAESLTACLALSMFKDEAVETSFPYGAKSLRQKPQVYSFSWHAVEDSLGGIYRRDEQMIFITNAGGIFKARKIGEGYDAGEKLTIPNLFEKSLTFYGYLY